MLERYLDLERLPKKPKWGLVFRTCDWVLRECEEQQPLKQEILQRKQLIEGESARQLTQMISCGCRDLVESSLE